VRFGFVAAGVVRGTCSAISNHTPLCSLVWAQVQRLGSRPGDSRNAAQFPRFFSSHSTSPDFADGWSKPGQIEIRNESVSMFRLEKTEILRRMLRSQPLRPRGILPGSRLKWGS
jgi:hypothetical protein